MPKPRKLILRADFDGSLVAGGDGGGCGGDGGGCGGDGGGCGRRVFHCVSRVVDRRFVFGEAEREEFARLLRAVEGFSGVRVLAWTILSNHFHLLLEVPGKPAGFDLGEDEFWRRIGALYSGEEAEEMRAELRSLARVPGGLAGEAMAREFRRRYLDRMRDLSEFMKTLKQRFTVWINGRAERVGTLWESRFRAVLVEGVPETLEKVSAYIDLNAVRAGMVSDPKDYRWCGYAEALGAGRKETGELAREALGVVTGEGAYGVNGQGSTGGKGCGVEGQGSMVNGPVGEGSAVEVEGSKVNSQGWGGSGVDGQGSPVNGQVGEGCAVEGDGATGNGEWGEGGCAVEGEGATGNCQGWGGSGVGERGAMAEGEWRRVLAGYRRLLFGLGDPAGPGKGGFTREQVAAVLEVGGKLTLAQLLRCRVRHFSEGLVLGSREFVERYFEAAREDFGARRTSGARKIRGSDATVGLYAVRDLRKQAITGG